MLNFWKKFASNATILIIFVGYTAFILAAGWQARVMSESRAELAVIVDDGDFERRLLIQVDIWVNEFNTFMENFYYGYEVPECISDSYPEHYLYNDYELRSDRESEEQGYFE